MITFRETMDPDSRDLLRDDVCIGLLLTHSVRPAQVQLNDPKMGGLTIDEMRQIIAKHDEIKAKKAAATKL